MKRNLLSILMALTFLTCFSSCDKDDDEHEKTIDLGGTEWKYEATGVTTTLFFLDDTRVKRTRVLYGYSYNSNYTYYLKGKNGVIYNYYDGKDYTFTIDGSKLTLDYEKYYKK